MELEQLMKALGEPMRLRIFCLLLERKHCVRSLSKKLGVTESAVSQHLKVMRSAGVIYGEKYGYHTHYLPVQEAVDFLAEAFGNMRTTAWELNRDASVCQCEFRKEGEV